MTQTGGIHRAPLHPRAQHQQYPIQGLYGRLDVATTSTARVPYRPTR